MVFFPLADLPDEHATKALVARTATNPKAEYLITFFRFIGSPYRFRHIKRHSKSIFLFYQKSIYLPNIYFLWR